jgi:hypothetical protein
MICSSSLADVTCSPGFRDLIIVTLYATGHGRLSFASVVLDNAAILVADHSTQFSGALVRFTPIL